MRLLERVFQHIVGVFIVGFCFSITSSANTVIANGDFVKMQQGEQVKINVTNNDFGLQDGVGSLTVLMEATNGTTQVTDDNQILYIPNPTFSGKDEFTYKVCDINGNCDEAKVSIEVSYFNYIPIANNDTATIISGQQKDIDVLENDEGIIDAPLELIILTPLNNGYEIINGDLTITPSFDINFIGLDSLQYEVCDADMDCDNAWLFINVAKDKNYEVFIPQGISPDGDGLNDTFFIRDFEGLKMEIQIMSSLGEVVYEDLNYQNNWDCIANTGKYSGQLLKKGTYYYTLKIKDTKQVYSRFVYINY